MADPFELHIPDLHDPASVHFAITPADTDLAVKPRALYVTVAGNLVLLDKAGRTVTYPVTAGQIIPFRPVQVRAATTATVVGWY